MNVALQSSIADIELDVGGSLTLNACETGYLIRSGRVELYATLFRDGRPDSGRHFLFALGEGELIPPLAAEIEGLALLVVAVEGAVLFPVSLSFIVGMAGTKERGPVLNVQIDRWVSRLATALVRMLGPMPAGTVAQPIGEAFQLAEGDLITLQSGVGWLASSEAEFMIAAGDPAPRFEALQATIVAPGLWISGRRGGKVVVLPTAAALQQGIWPSILTGFHRQALTIVIQHLVMRDAATLDLAQTRKERTSRTLDRALGRFAGVLDHAPAWTGAAAPDERLLGPFVMVCEAVGIELTQQVRETIRRVMTVEEAARAARVRQRQIALRGNWWRDDFGSFIGFLDEERRPVAVLRTGAGRWRIVDPDGGDDLIVDAQVAQRLQPMGYMLYRTFPAKPLEFKDILFLGWKQNRADVYTSIAAALAMSLLGLATPLAMRLAFDRFIPSHEIPQLFELAIGLVLAATIAAGFRLAYDMAFLRVDGKMASQTQAAIVDRVLRLPPAMLRFSSADLAQRALAVDSVRRTTLGFVLGSVSSGFALLFNGALMAYYAPLATVVASLCFLLLLALVYLGSTRQLEAIRRGEQLMSDINTLVFHLVRGIGVLRTTGAEGRAFARWAHDFAEMRARAHRSQIIGAVVETFLAGFDVLTMAGVFLMLASLPAKDFSTGSFISFVASYGIFMASSVQLARGLGTLINTRPSWERATPLLKSIPEGGITKRDPGVLSGAVEMTNVVFRYGQDTPYVLSGLSLKIAAGEFVALVGASGSGKSTTTRLLLGDQAPLAGAIQYDSMDLKHLDLELVRRQIGVVLQNGKLMPGSIYENIMGAHHGTLDDAWEAARQAGLEPDIKALPMGMHTILTEATAAFSGGQIQRMMIARALVGKPRLLILDEATSALDNITQAVVATALSRLAVTRIVIAHRLSTVRNADRICVLDGGRIVQAGTYDDLIAANGPFAELARRQLI
jgi:NHLM bacteriocin system ABC transporter ATP-binding protein